MRISSGVPGFDELVEGGLLQNRLYVLSGPPGSGKTTCSAHFIKEGTRVGDKCLYMSMHETKEELIQDMANYNFGFADAVRSNQVGFLNVFESQSRDILIPRERGDYRSNVENMTTRIVNFIDKHSIDRLVIDSTMLLEYFYSEDSKTFIQFISSLKQADATTLLISEMTDPTAYADEHYLAHGVIFFHNYLEPSGMTRGVQIIKMRGTNIDSDIRSIEFSDSGLSVRPSKKVEQHV
jgi:KaiC/GvpD/RAD55 family RecA-like ATPase